MNSQIMGLRVAGVVFGVMSLAQLARLLIRPEVVIAGHLVPLWPSGLAFLLLIILSLWLFTLARPHW